MLIIDRIKRLLGIRLTRDIPLLHLHIGDEQLARVYIGINGMTINPIDAGPIILRAGQELIIRHNDNCTVTLLRVRRARGKDQS
jgi:hypothetical protein